MGLRTLRQNPRTEIKEPVIARSRRRRSNLARIENLKQRLLRSPRNDTLTVCQTGGVLSRSPNILLADKSDGATERQTRNGAGKTSLIELIHFLMGATCGPSSLFRHAALSRLSFGMEFDLDGIRPAVERLGRNHQRIVLAKGGGSPNWPITPHLDKEEGDFYFQNNEWKNVLGRIFFHLKDGGDGGQKEKFIPTFRSLFAYFVRRQEAGAFIEPQRQSEKQELWDQQVAISYLLGIDWTIQRNWQSVRQRERSLSELRKAAGDEVLKSVIGTTASLRTELIIAEEQARQLRETLSGFRVLPEYKALEQEASEITSELGLLADGNTIDLQLIKELDQSFEDEETPPLDDLERLYKEIGQVLPAAIKKRFEDVKLFHESVIQNRKSYLAGEIEAARQRINKREQSMGQLDLRRAAIMAILNSHGALENYAKLQTELSRLEVNVESLRQRLYATEQLEGRKVEIEIERRQLLLRLQQDFHEQDNLLKQAILGFEQVSKALYEEAGSLTINPSANGPEFGFQIQGLRSKGIKNMQIFCFDMMLMQLCVKRGMGPGFLIHDSHLFDGVDERQIAKALQVGAQEADKLSFQYIVTMNSDVFPRGFGLEEYVLPVRLTDATEDGGLFGIRFN